MGQWCPAIKFTCCVVGWCLRLFGCPYLVVYDKNGCRIAIFFGFHSNPVYSFKDSGWLGVLAWMLSVWKFGRVPWSQIGCPRCEVSCRGK